MVAWFRFSLRAWDRRGLPIRRAELLDRLSIAPGDPVSVEEGPRGPRVVLLTVMREDFAHVDTTADAGARSEAFAAALRVGLERAATWMDRQPPDVFEQLRVAGRVTEVFVSGEITQDQLDLDLPPAFLRACGALGLTLSVCTND